MIYPWDLYAAAALIGLHSDGSSLEAAGDGDRTDEEMNSVICRWAAEVADQMMMERKKRVPLLIHTIQQMKEQSAV